MADQYASAHNKDLNNTGQINKLLTMMPQTVYTLVSEEPT